MTRPACVFNFLKWALRLFVNNLANLMILKKNQQSETDELFSAFSVNNKKKAKQINNK